jgi:D-glycero-alpha-D-manno-heptose-7-phosphate kinase
LAELASEIELIKLKEPIGKQDQYISAFGGLTMLTFNKDETVKVEPLAISITTQHDLEDNLLLFYTGISRSASSILMDQDSRSKNNEVEILENLHFTKDIGYKIKEALILGDTFRFGQLMNEHWEHKKYRSPGMSSEQIDSIYNTALKNGAVGGKLVGAGGGGFLMFYVEDKQKLRESMNKLNLEEVRFNFDFEGTKVVMS